MAESGSVVQWPLDVHLESSRERITFQQEQRILDVLGTRGAHQIIYGGYPNDLREAHGPKGRATKKHVRETEFSPRQYDGYPTPRSP